MSLKVTGFRMKNSPKWTLRGPPVLLDCRAKRNERLSRLSSIRPASHSTDQPPGWKPRIVRQQGPAQPAIWVDHPGGTTQQYAYASNSGGQLAERDDSTNYVPRRRRQGTDVNTRSEQSAGSGSPFRANSNGVSEPSKSARDSSQTNGNSRERRRMSEGDPFDDRPSRSSNANESSSGSLRDDTEGAESPRQAGGAWQGLWGAGQARKQNKSVRMRSLWGRSFPFTKAKQKQSIEDDWAGVSQMMPDEDDGWGSRSPSNPPEPTADSSQRTAQPDQQGSVVSSEQVGRQETRGEQTQLNVEEDGLKSPSSARRDSGFREDSRPATSDPVYRPATQTNVRDSSSSNSSMRDWQSKAESNSRGFRPEAGRVVDSRREVAQPSYGQDPQAPTPELDAELLGETTSDWDTAAEDWEEGDGPDITLLSPSETDELLPVVPTADQMGYAWGNAVDLWQRLGSAAFVTIITVKLNLILVASGAASYPFWGPLLTAANRNRVLRKSGRHVGFWRTRVIDMTIERPQRQRYNARSASALGVAKPTIRFLLGDASGARSSVSVPLNKRYEAVQIGEPAEALVLSGRSTFDSFKALKEVYFPESGLWMSEYPHINRNLFLDISLDIERQRRLEMMEGAFDAAP